MKIVSASKVILSSLRFCEICRKPMGRNSEVMRCIGDNSTRRIGVCKECFEELVEGSADK